MTNGNFHIVKMMMMMITYSIVITDRLVFSTALAYLYDSLRPADIRLSLSLLC